MLIIIQYTYIRAGRRTEEQSNAIIAIHAPLHDMAVHHRHYRLTKTHHHFSSGHMAYFLHGSSRGHRFFAFDEWKCCLHCFFNANKSPLMEPRPVSITGTNYVVPCPLTRLIRIQIMLGALFLFDRSFHMLLPCVCMCMCIAP